MSSVIIVHPYDISTSFLSPISDALTNHIKIGVKTINISTNNNSHIACLAHLKEKCKNEFVIFLGHGGSDYVLGASGDYADALVSGGFEDENPDQVYKHGHFIDVKNIEVLSHKKIFCLSCYSALGLGKLAIENGALVFLGFDYIPTSTEEFKIKNFDVTENDVEIFKKIILVIFTKSLLFAYDNRLNFIELKSIIRMNINIESINLIRTGSNNRRILADALFYLKNGIRIFGNRNLKVFH